MLGSVLCIKAVSGVNNGLSTERGKKKKRDGALFSQLGGGDNCAVITSVDKWWYERGESGHVETVSPH